MPYDKIDQLYEALKKDGAVNNSRENFRSKMLAPGKEGYQNRLQLYNALKADGAVDSPTYEEFRNRLGLRAANAVSLNKSGLTKVAGGHPMSAAQKQLMLGSVRGLVANAKAGVAGARDRIANQMAMVKKPFNTSPQIGENKNVREKGYRYNDNSGKLEKTYVTTLGNEYDSRYNADQEQKQIDQLNHDSSLGGQLENAYGERDRLDEALKKRRQEVDQSEGKLARFLRGLAANSSSGNGAGAYQEQEMRYNNDPEYLQLMAAARKNHQTIQLLEDKKNNKMNEFWHNVGTTMLNGYTFSDGLSEMQDAIALQEAEKHLDSINKKRAKGKKLTRDEQAAEAVLKNFATDDAMQGLYGDDYGAWGRAGKMFATSIDYGKDFLLNPSGGALAKGVSKGFVKGATKGLTKLAGKQAEKLLAKKAMQYTLKATGIGVGAHLGGLAIANTTVLPKTVGQLGTATSGHVVADDKGSYHVVDKQKLLPALAEVERSQAREYGSEMIGEFLPGGKILKKGLTKGLEKIGLSKVASTFTNIGTKQWYKQYSNLLKAGGYNGIPGEVMEEYEGSLFDALTGHADDAWRDMTSLRNHVDIWLGCGTMGAIMGTVPMMGAVNHTANYYGYKHKTDKADKVASSLVGDEKWGAIRDKIDQTENGKMADVLAGILMDKELNDNAKNATLDYVRNLTKMRGYNIANVNCAAEESMEATPTDQHEGEAAQQQDRQNGAKIIAERMNASYGMGYNVTDAPSMYDAGVTLKAQENRLSKLLGADDVRKAMGEDPMAFVEKRKQAGASAEELQAMEDYLVADSAVKGIRQRMADNLDSRLSESDAEMGKRINTEDGMVHKAVMQVRNQDGKEHEVYVLKGNVRMNADGRGVDASSSDNEIYVYDPQEGKTRMMPPSFIERIDEPVDAETVRRSAGESIRQDYQSELGKLDTSGLSFQVGDRYDAVDERGVQHRIEVVGGAVDDAGNAMNGYVGVRVDGGEAISMRTDEIAKMVGNADVQRREAELSGEVGEDGHASETDHAVDVEAAGDVPTYAQNEVLTLLDEHGNPVRAEITAAANEDGLYEVQTDDPIDGKRVSMMSAEEIAAKSPFQEEPSDRMDNDTEDSLQGQEDDTTHEAAETNDVKSALSRIPMDEETQEPRYEEVDADTAWDAIVEQTNGDRALAQEVVDDTVNEMSAGIEKAEKAISKATFKGKGIQERIAFAKDKQERMAALDLEKERLAKWKRIASVERMRAAAVEAEKSRAASAERKARQEEEEKARQAREEAERKEREALNGVPNMTEDKPSDARARGYRRVDGHKVDRQAPVKAVKGKEVQVKFDDKNIPAGHVAVVDASELQPSHIGGQRNAKHFIDEAQPKERKDDASVEAARKIATNIRPEEITTSVTAYTGAPTVNSRGEVIQGNNRSAALKEMWVSHPEQGTRYKQYLKEHAAEYGLTAEDIDKVQSPVLVNMLDVSDADAIALGQFVASDTESGGTERLKPKNVTKKLGDRMKTFSNILLRSSDDESSFSELLDRNGMETLKWLNGIGAITPTQYKSSFDSKGNLTAEAKNDLKGVLYQYVFEGGSTQLEEMFNGLPAKAQRAILSTVYRDYESVKDERMIEEIQDSIMAYHALSKDAQFMSATNHKDARTAVESWKRQYAIDDVTGESYLPSEKFSNFALLLAVMYKGDTQSYIQAKFNAMYDLIQGVREDTLFGTPDNTPRTLAEAIKEELNIDYDGQQRSDVLVGGNQVSQAREQGSPTGAERGEQSEAGEQPTDSGTGTEGNTGKQVAHKDNTLFQYFTGSLADMIARAKLSATDFAKKVLAPVSSRLKEDLQAHGVKLDGDFNHVIDNAAIRHTLKQHGGKNEEKRGQIPITDADFGRIPDVVENYDEITVVDGKRGDVNIIYSRTYEDGTTVFVEEKREKRKELAAVTMWKKQSPTLTDANRENTTPISDLSETSSGGKDTNNLDTKQENEEKVVSQAGEPLSEKIESASEDVDTAPTEAQKEAGNYKKGHVQVGKFDITIEQPQGSIRKGMDANGKAWESKMHNTYGYIRGTVGVDGDHIDVFLSNDIDGWDGRKVYVVDQYNPDGSFDEHKVMLGFNDINEAKSDYLANYEKGWEKGRRIDVSATNLVDFEKWIASSKRKTKPFAKYAGLKKEDSQGNPLNADGTLKLEKIKSVDDLTDDDFSNPTRSVELPKLQENVDRALGAEGKPVIIKKNILEKNYKNHPDLTPNQSREILESALYRPDLYGNNQKTKRPYNWVVINTTDEAGHNRLVLLEVNKNKDNVEIVHWHYIRDNALGTLKKQAEREGGLILILPSEQSEEAGGLSSRTPDLSSDDKDSKVLDTKQENLSENDRANLSELSDFAVDTDSAKRTIVDAASFDSENLTVSLLIDGKPSRLSVATIVPDVITDRSYQTAVYDYSDDIDNKTNSGWQKWEELSDEYNSKVSEEERASVFGDSAELHFKTVDAAVKFDDWLRTGRIEKQQSADELRNDTAAKQLATNAVLDALDNAGISVEVVSDEVASEMLDRNNAKAESANEEDLETTDHVQFMRMGGKKKSTPETASPDNQDQPTVVSSADGANILKSLDSEIKKYENVSSYPKTFIGDVSKALGATRQGSASEYASFETKSGKTVTIRLSNHNAKVSTFDAHHEAEGISIVVTPKENKGISNDGNAHVTEFYYNAIKLRRAEGKPLVEILKSIKQALYSGAYTDNTGLAEVKEVNVPTASDGQTDSGKVYGWTADGKIFLTKDGINPNTPIHEYTHLWAGAMRQRNAKGWQSVKDLLKGTPIWNEVLNDPNYRSISADEDAVASEALSRISGRENAKKMEAEAQRMIDEADGIGEKADTISLLDRMRRALDAFWRWVGKNLFEIKKFESIEEVTDRVLYDLTTGTDLQNDRSLMAVHNISVDKLQSALELGGFPMPSIAITNANMGHAGYGDISLVFTKESIDPSKSRNKVYSGDAWTPTFPQIGYKLNDKKTNEIYKRANEVGSLPLFNPVYFHPDNYEGKIDRRGDASLVDRFKEDYGAKQMYLAERGNAVKAFVQHEVPKYSPEKVSLYKKILETIGLERLKNDNLDSVKSDLMALGINGKSTNYYEWIVLCAIDYAEDGNTEIKKDVDATEQEIDKRIDTQSFSAWLEQLFDGVVEKKGIRNERDMFTPSGNSRKWESLYDAVTLDNVIRSMQQQSKKGGSGFFNSSIFGASTNEFPSIDAIRREAKLRINSIPNEKMDRAKGRIIDRLQKVTIPSVEKGVSDAFDFVENVIKAVSKSHTPSGIYKFLHTYYPDMTMEAAKEISDIVGDIQKMSTKYFEAKPYRAVGFDEVRAAIVPNDVPQEIIDGLRERGIKVVSYEKGNEQERKDALSSVTREMDIRFQIKGKDEPSAEKSERNHAADEVVNELDKRYMEAVKRGDMATAQRMVNEAARRSGYFPGSNYQGTSAFNGSAPYGNGYFITPEERKEAFENDEFDGDTTLADYVTGGIDPMNLDFLLSENNYRHSDAARKEAIDNIREVVRTKGQRVTMYRSVPSSVKEGSFRNGDWVTPSRKYAEENARVHGWGNAYRIIEQDIPISDVWFDGNDIAEWGYGSEGDFLNDKDYLYGNTLNNRKLPDAVTYDDNGDIIPLSKRFDTMSGDLRFRMDKNFENPNVSDGNVLRERHGVNGDEDISLSHDAMSKLLGESVYTDAQRKAFGERERKRMAVHVSELSEKLNLKNVDVVTDASTLSGDRRRAKGFFNKKTGRITIVTPNHTDMADVEKTLLHEAVAHHGLRKLFGENFDNFLDNVYRNAEYDIRERISEMSSNHGWDVRTATEEYLAGLAEDTNFENMPDGFWSKIKQFFLQMLHSIGFKNLTDVSMGDNELRYVLWRSYENLKEPGRYRNFFAEAADVAKQYQLKVRPYEMEAKKDMDDLQGAAESNKADTGDVLYRSGVERTVERVPDIVVSQLYEDAVKDTRDRTMLGALVRIWSKDGRTRFKNKFAESYFDYSRSVKALQDAIAKATGRKVEWFEDVWKSLNAKSSIDEREQEVMTRTLAIPLSRHISSMVRQSGGKYDLDAIEAYLNAKHGLERNELMARRAAKEAAEEAYGAEMEQCRKALAADALDTTAEERLQELTSQYDAMVEESYAENRRDYAGLTALFDPGQEGMSLEELEDAARKYISEIEGYYDADTVDGLWDKVRSLNNFSLKKSYESGLLSKKQYDEISKMYKWYVPLRGWHDNYAGDVYNYVNRGADRGMIENAVKKAYGRTSRAGNILGTMSAMANSAIVVGNKNKVAQVFMNLALNHEDTGLFTISEAWYEKNEADDSWHIVTPDNRIHEGMTAEEVADTIAKWEDEMREKAANGKALMRSGKFSKDFQHNLEVWKEQQHCVRVSRGGKEYLVYVNGNPRATQAINGLLNPDYQPGIAENLLQKYMRHLARVQTSWSPKFVMSNLQRDMLTATGSAYAKHGAGYALQFEQNFAMNSKDIFGLFYKDLHGSLDMGNAKERMFKEFLDNGGKTGISAIGKKQEYEEKYNKSIRRAMHPASSAVMQGAEGIVQGVEFMNNCIENLTRFSTYITSRQMGKSIKDAIFDAKECSVNFNMKGSGAWGNATLRKYILYTNPALQALRMLNSWYEANNVRTVGMLASGVALGFTVAMVNAMCNGGDGDDNAYYGLSDYNRYTYFNIGIGNRKFLHWRLPQEMSPLYALGHISYDLMTERISTERAIQMSLEQLNNYSPLSLIEGNPNYDQSADNTYAKTFLKAITPSYLSPFTDAFLWDEDFLGRSIGNRNEWNKRKPEWQRVDKRTPEWFIKPFEAVGKVTGSNGSDRKGLTNSPVFNPSAWWFVLMQQGGGLAQVGEQAFNACAVVLGSKDADDMELKDYPFVSTVLVDAGTDNARMRIKNERFWMYRSEYEANKATISNITHSRDLSPVEKAEKISSMQDSRYTLMDYFMKKYYKPLREGIAEAEANKDKAETKRLKGLLNEVKGMLLERIDKAEGASPDLPEGKGKIQTEG